MTMNTTHATRNSGSQEAPFGRDVAAWRAADLDRDVTWLTTLDEADRADLLRSVRAGISAGKPLLEYTRQDFPFELSTISAIRQAVDEAQHGRGVALIKGLPRAGVSASEFELLTWAIGLHLGVARPQDKMSHYINPVRDVGTVYRSPTGRGYSSNAELDFHVDGADIVLLSCYNQAPKGGDSMCCSSVAAFRQLAVERPDLLDVLMHPFPFGRQGEQAEGVAAFMPMPIFGLLGSETFCMFVRNRIEQGEKLPGAPALTPRQLEAMDLLDEIVRRPEFMYSMRLEPGDLQILSNHTALHSRTQFHDAPEPERKRLLYRLWLSTPDAPRLPDAWSAYYESTEPGTVRGGSRGQHYTDECRRFDARQAKDLGMRQAI